MGNKDKIAKKQSSNNIICFFFHISVLSFIFKEKLLLYT